MARKQGKSRKISIPSKMLLFFNILVALLLVLSILSVYISPVAFWPLAFLGLAYPIILLLNLFFVLFWIVFLKRYFILSLLIILLGYEQFTTMIRFNRKSERITTRDGVSVMSYNVRLFDLYNWNTLKKKSQAREEIFSLIREEPVDILCLQEYYSGRKSSVDYAKSILGYDNYHYFIDTYIDKGSGMLPFGLATFSKYPIFHSEKKVFRNSPENLCIITDIVFPEDTIRVINTHLESIRFGKEDYHFMNELTNTNGSNNDLSQGSRAILRKMKRAFMKRAEQVDELAEIIAESPFKVILCADFNDTPVSYVYRKIAKTHQDAFRVEGSGFGQTYAKFLPTLRIDYIFADESMKVLDFEVLQRDYSDHYPIKATIKLKE